MLKQKGSSDIDVMFALSFMVWIFASWLTHIIIFLKAGSWGFLIAGAIMFPVAVIHGTGFWFGAW